MSTRAGERPGSMSAPLPAVLGIADGLGLREVDRLERNAFVWKDRLELTLNGRRTENHLRPQQQGGGDGFGIQNIQKRITTLHIDHRRDDESWFRQADVVG